jgi:hypothetical protein
VQTFHAIRPAKTARIRPGRQDPFLLQESAYRGKREATRVERLKAEKEEKRLAERHNDYQKDAADREL